MANQHRRIKRQVRAAVKKLMKGEIPLPPEPAAVSPEDEAEFWAEMDERQRFVKASVDRLATDGSRAGHKKRLRLDAELVSLEALFAGRQAPR